MPMSPLVIETPKPPAPADACRSLSATVIRVAPVRTELPTVGLTVDSLSANPAEPVITLKMLRPVSEPLSENSPGLAVIGSETDPVGAMLAPGSMLGVKVVAQSNAVAPLPAEPIASESPVTDAVMLPPRLSEPARPLPVTPTQYRVSVPPASRRAMPMSPPVMETPKPPAPADAWRSLSATVIRVAPVRTEPPTVGLTVNSLNAKFAEPVTTLKMSRLVSEPLSSSSPPVSVMGKVTEPAGVMSAPGSTMAPKLAPPFVDTAAFQLSAVAAFVPFVPPAALMATVSPVTLAETDAAQRQGRGEAIGGHGEPVPRVVPARRLGGLDDRDAQVAAGDRHPEAARARFGRQVAQGHRDQGRAGEGRCPQRDVHRGLAHGEIGRSGQDVEDVEIRQRTADHQHGRAELDRARIHGDRDGGAGLVEVPSETSYVKLSVPLKPETGE